MTTSIRSDATKSVIQVNGVDKFAIGSAGELYANGNSAGTAGQVLQSGGAGQPAVWGAGSVGVGQTWQDVTGSRVSGTTYTNNTGKPIMVAVVVVVHSGSSGYESTILVSGVQVGRAYGAGTPQIDVYSQLTAIVPDGATYVVTTSYTGVGNWAELR